MPITEVAFNEQMTPETLRAALGHITDLSYVSIRLAGVVLLLKTGSSDAMTIGFLVNGHAFEILDLDAQEMRRLEHERQLQWTKFLNRLGGRN